jgi:hypothetical protein
LRCTVRFFNRNFQNQLLPMIVGYLWCILLIDFIVLFRISRQILMSLPPILELIFLLMFFILIFSILGKSSQDFTQLLIRCFTFCFNDINIGLINLYKMLIRYKVFCYDDGICFLNYTCMYTLIMKCLFAGFYLFSQVPNDTVSDWVLKYLSAWPWYLWMYRYTEILVFQWNCKHFCLKIVWNQQC